MNKIINNKSFKSQTNNRLNQLNSSLFNRESSVFIEKVNHNRSSSINSMNSLNSSRINSLAHYPPKQIYQYDHTLPLQCNLKPRPKHQPRLKLNASLQDLINHNERLMTKVYQRLNNSSSQSTVEQLEIKRDESMKNYHKARGAQVFLPKITGLTSRNNPSKLRTRNDYCFSKMCEEDYDYFDKNRKMMYMKKEYCFYDNKAHRRGREFDIEKIKLFQKRSIYDPKKHRMNSNNNSNRSCLYCN